jgi:hypothetical protein
MNGWIESCLGPYTLNNQGNSQTDRQHKYREKSGNSMHTQHRYSGRAEINSQYTTDSGVDTWLIIYKREVKNTNKHRKTRQKVKTLMII